jgi:hypothetical protein
MARALPVLGVDPDASNQENAALILPVRMAELLAWERHAYDPNRVYELHQMRIAAKRMRYTMELFAPFYGPDFAKAILSVKEIQEDLGVIHDADVLVPEMEAFLRKELKPRKKRKRQVDGVHAADLDAAAGVVELCRRKRDERDERYRRFLATWNRLRTEGFFESIRAMLREGQVAVPSGSMEETRNGRNQEEGRKSTGRGRRGRADAGNTAGHGADPGPGAAEGGLGQHSLFEEGDSR